MKRFVPCLATIGLVFHIVTSPALAASGPPPDLRKDLEAILHAGKHPDLREVAIADVRSELERLYAAQGWQPLWLDRARPSDAATKLVARLVAADSLGLEPADYDAGWLDQTAAGLKRGREAHSAQDLARFDTGLSVAAARFVLDLSCGRVDPVTVSPEYDIPRLCPEVDSTLALLRDAKMQGAVLASAQPPFLQYQLLKNGLPHYRALARDESLVPLPAMPKDVRPGQSLRAAAELRRLLRATGDLSKGKTPKAARDTVYSPELVLAVKRFQDRHGLLPDGILWSQTLDELRRPFGERVRQIELALERWRWLPRTYDAPPVIVNIAAFRLDALNAPPDRRENTLAMDVLVGAAGFTETTELSARMTHVVFRPFWEVPHELAVHEFGPRAEWDRENLERLGYILVRRNGSDSTGLPLTAENLKRLGKDLRLRQRPGSLNSLGLVKFMLPNQHDIYLHDTPVPGLFAMPRRDFSHGCVRVSEPVALATHVLRGLPDWTPERVKAAMESGEDNVRVDLPQGIPVLIIYVTAAPADNGDVRFYADIYERDTKLDAALRKEAPLSRSGAKAANSERQGRISTGVPTGITR